MNPLEPNEESLQPVVLDAVEAAAINQQIATAKRYPRTLSKVKQDMMSFATLDEDTAASCFYTLPRGGKNIQGPSVRLAEIAISCYGNLRAGTRVVATHTQGDNPHVIVQAVCHDLEKNVAITMEKRRRITKKKSKETIDEDDINLACNACSAIALRDAVYKVVPLALVKPVYEAAKRVAIGEASSLVAKRGKVIDRLKQMGVTEERILGVLDVRKVDDIVLEHLEILIGLGTAIKDGDTTIEEAFPAPSAVPKAEAAPGPQAPAKAPFRTNRTVQPQPDMQREAAPRAADPTDAPKPPEGNRDMGPHSNVVDVTAQVQKQEEAKQENPTPAAVTTSPPAPEPPSEPSPQEKSTSAPPASAPKPEKKEFVLPPSKLPHGWLPTLDPANEAETRKSFTDWLGMEEITPEEFLAWAKTKGIAKDGQKLSDLGLNKIMGVLKQREICRKAILQNRQ